jgi:geranylgeranyl reductase family protein
VIAGAGPAGSSAARVLAKNGFKVLLLEEHSNIGVPLHCSGLVTPRTLDEAGFGNNPVLNRITGAHIHTTSGTNLTIGGGKTQALVIDRVKLDRMLAEEAQNHGTDLQLNTKLVSIERYKGELRIRTQRNGTHNVINTKLLIGADGTHSRVARYMGLSEPVERVVGLGGEGILPHTDTDNVNVFVGNAFSPGWFAWTIPLGNGKTRIGIGTSGGMKPSEGLARLFETFPEHFKEWKPLQWTGGTIPLWSRRHIVADNVMLVGDAAAQVKPTSGGGIYPGMVGGRLAAQIGTEALSKNDLSSNTLKAYPKLWNDSFGKEFKKGSDLRHVFRTLEDRDFDKLIHLFGRPRLLRTINKYGDIDFPGQMFTRLTSIAPLLWMFVRTPLRYMPLWK